MFIELNNSLLIGFKSMPHSSIGALKNIPQILLLDLRFLYLLDYNNTYELGLKAYRNPQYMVGGPKKGLLGIIRLKRKNYGD